MTVETTTGCYFLHVRHLCLLPPLIFNCPKMFGILWVLLMREMWLWWKDVPSSNSWKVVKTGRRVSTMPWPFSKVRCCWRKKVKVEADIHSTHHLSQFSISRLAFPLILHFLPLLPPLIASPFATLTCTLMHGPGFSLRLLPLPVSPSCTVSSHHSFRCQCRSHLGQIPLPISHASFPLDFQAFYFYRE